MAIQKLNQGTIAASSQLPFYDAQNGKDRRSSVTELAALLNTLLNIPSTPGGSSAFSALTGLPTDNAALNAELHANAVYTTANAMTGGVINTTKGRNTQTVASNTSLTYSASPTVIGTAGSVVLTNSSANDLTHTLAGTNYSIAQNANITSISHPANSTIEFYWEWFGTGYFIRGEPVLRPFKASFSLDGTSAAQDYTIVLDGPASVAVITSVVSECASGTATATVKIAGVALGGTPNAVSSAKQTQAHASANVWSPGQKLAVGMTAGAVRPAIDVVGYYR
jgi:hypothetical protein